MRGTVRADVLALLAAVALTAVFLGTYGPHEAPGEPEPVYVREHTRPAQGPGEYVRPSHKDLLAGRACIPLAELLLNRAIPAIHSYSRSVACE